MMNQTSQGEAMKMTTTEHESLAKAIAHLGAVEVAPGKPHTALFYEARAYCDCAKGEDHYGHGGSFSRYAVRGEIDGRWYVTSEAGLLDIYSALESEVYREAEPPTKMPTKATHGWDWSPEQRFAWRVSDGEGTFEDAVFTQFEDASDAGDQIAPRLSPERITADLKTGEVIPC